MSSLQKTTRFVSLAFQPSSFANLWRAFVIQEALDLAQSVFPDELGNVSRDRITFTVNALAQGQRRAVVISQHAWSAVVARLLRGEIIQVHVKRESREPPMYLEVPDHDSKEARDYYSRSVPSSRSNSRTRASSPSAKSVNSISDDERNPRKKNNWLKNKFS